jgi:propionyl-CoA carboxylase alpha chain
VIAHAATREQAARGLATSLRLAAIHGPTTNRDLLVRVLEHPEFLSGQTDTHFLDRIGLDGLAQPLADSAHEHLAAVAAALSDQAVERARVTTLRSIPPGWRNNPGSMQERTYVGETGDHVVRYSAVSRVVVEGFPDLELIEWSPGSVAVTTGGAEHRFSISRYGDIRHIESGAVPIRLVATPRFPSAEEHEAAGSLHAPMPGRVSRVDATVGDRVEQGQVLVVLEAMKMEHSLRAPHDGTVIERLCEPGDQVEAGAVLVVVE